MPKQKKQHSRAEIAKKLAQANRLARQGKLQSEIARTLGVSVMTLHRWRKALLGAPTRSGDQIAQLQLEISPLRRLVTDLLLLEKIKRRSQRPSWRRQRSRSNTVLVAEDSAVNQATSPSASIFGTTPATASSSTSLA